MANVFPHLRHANQMNNPSYLWSGEAQIYILFIAAQRALKIMIYKNSVLLYERKIKSEQRKIF